MVVFRDFGGEGNRELLINGHEFRQDESVLEICRVTLHLESTILCHILKYLKCKSLQIIDLEFHMTIALELLSDINTTRGRKENLLA